MKLYGSMRKIYTKKDGQTIVINPHQSQDWEIVVGNLETTVIISLWDYSGELRAKFRLVKPGTQVKIIGLVVGRADCEIRLHTLQLHEAPETTSDLLVKAVLLDQAAFVYDGAIRIEPIGQKSNAYQRNENLLLSSKARVDSRPGLEILANDVRCTHGATVAPINPEELWYLSTRGISDSVGRKLIVNGFLSSAAERISDLKIRYQVLRQIDPEIKIN